MINDEPSGCGCGLTFWCVLVIICFACYALFSGTHSSALRWYLLGQLLTPLLYATGSKIGPVIDEEEKDNRSLYWTSRITGFYTALPWALFVVYLAVQCGGYRFLLLVTGVIGFAVLFVLGCAIGLVVWSVAQLAGLLLVWAWGQVESVVSEV